MTIEKAANRLTWRFSSNTSFKPNKEDLEAVNTLFVWIASQKEISLLNQGLFAKLYIYQLNQTLLYHNSTVFDNTVQKDLSKILSYPLEYFYESFHKSLHHNQLSKLKIKDGISLEDVKEKFTLPIVKDKLNNMITEAINKFL